MKLITTYQVRLQRTWKNYKWSRGLRLNILKKKETAYLPDKARAEFEDEQIILTFFLLIKLQQVASACFRHTLATGSKDYLSLQQHSVFSEASIIFLRSMHVTSNARNGDHQGTAQTMR